jgi:hypothetical protein
MATGPTSVHWAVAFAALVGGVVGSFVAASMDSVGLSTEGSLPLLAGDAAIYVAFLMGALLGASVGALTAFAIGRQRRQRIAAVAGSVAGIAAGLITGYLSELLASVWINAFSGNPLEGALVGGAIAGGLAGVAVAAVLRLFPDTGVGNSANGRFAALLGSVAGALAGMGGASVGATLAQSVLVCPNGYSVYPYVSSGCSAGILQGSLLFGIWAGAVTGAVGALVCATVLRRINRLSTTMSPAGQD